MAAVPATMRIVGVSHPGGPDVLKVAEQPVPDCIDADVLIRVAAAGLNRADILQRRGHYPSPPGAPAHPGLEVSGTIVATGSGANSFAVGDRVCALLQGGGYSEYCAVNEGQVLPVPESMSFIEAAVLPEAAFTVWSNLYRFAKLAQGESLLVHGGSSGIGTFAIQLAKAMGSRVYTTVGTDEKARFCASLGATAAFNYKKQDFVSEIKAATGDRGVDVILDMVGGDYLERNLNTLADEGRLVVIATQSGSKAQIDLVQLMRRRLFITGSMLRTRSVDFKRSIRDELRQHVWPLLRTKKVRPVIDRTFDFEDAASAHAYMESSAHMGKIVLAVGAAQA
jgi:NADPH:quinone reductase